MINLERKDVYDNRQIPDEDMEIALKVIRTIRNESLGPRIFDVDGALILSHAHSYIYQMVQAIEKDEDFVYERRD